MMLDPNDRRLLLESLRPPEGFQLDYAVATTFSLDLIALLTAHVAFTFHDWEHQDGRPVVDPLVLLESLSSHASKLAVFCQADRISVPQEAHGLFGFLEDRVFPVEAPNPAGLFHPKVWVLRYAGGESAVRYRLLVTSRNLTFDRSWDTLLALDGVLEDRQKGFGNLRPLGDFVAALPGLGIHPVPPEATERVKAMASEVRRVRFELPEGVAEIQFWPLGLGLGPNWPFRGDGKRLVVVSPFVTGDALRRLAKTASECTLVSDAAELDKLGQGPLEDYSDVRILSPGAQATDPEEAESLAAGGAEGKQLVGAMPLLGLHAKLYALDRGKHAHVWTGSANATTAAFGVNVEFLAELVGLARLIGRDALLTEEKGETSFASLLEQYSPPDEPESDEDGEALAEVMDQLRLAVGRLPLQLSVSRAAEPDTYLLELEGPEIPLPGDDCDVTLTCRPISVGEGMAVPLALGEPALASFPRISFEALTSFMAFRASVTRRGRTLEERFVLNLPLRGAPAGRRERIIQNLLRDERAVLRFLLMLLAEDATLSAAAFAERGGEAAGFGSFGFGQDTLLESLLRALVREPRRLDRVAQILADLQSGDDPPPLPEDFVRLWRPVWAARQERPT
jgi:hypothetical protein